MTRFAVAVVVVGLALSFSARGVAAEKENRMLAHDVYFTLQDNSPEAQRRLVDACRKYLAGHPGTVWFSAGTRAPDFGRDVNDLDFEVALQIVFRDKAAHDQYQQDERHQQFIAESKANWKRVRVFDSYLDAAEPGR